MAKLLLLLYENVEKKQQRHEKCRRETNGAEDGSFEIERRGNFFRYSTIACSINYYSNAPSYSASSSRIFFPSKRTIHASWKHGWNFVQLRVSYRGKIETLSVKHCSTMKVLKEPIKLHRFGEFSCGMSLLSRHLLLTKCRHCLSVELNSRRAYRSLLQFLSLLDVFDEQRSLKGFLTWHRWSKSVHIDYCGSSV